MEITIDNRRWGEPLELPYNPMDWQDVTDSLGNTTMHMIRVRPSEDLPKGELMFVDCIVLVAYKGESAAQHGERVPDFCWTSDPLFRRELDQYLSGSRIVDTKFSAGSGRQVQIAILRVGSARSALRVVDVLKTSRTNVRYPAYSLGEIAQYSPETIFLSGGFGYSFEAPMPQGLLVTQGKTVSKPVALLGAIGIRSPSPLSGFACASNHSVGIAKISEYKSGMCQRLCKPGRLSSRQGEAGYISERAGKDRAGRAFSSCPRQIEKCVVAFCGPD